MVEAWMREWQDSSTTKITATTFASPGYPALIPGGDKRITNVWIDGDAIEKSTFFLDNRGDRNEIFHKIDVPTELEFRDGSVLHSMDLYLEYAKLLRSEGLGLKDLNRQGFDNIYANAVVAVELDPDGHRPAFLAGVLRGCL
jgi:hypothetical protein